MQEVRFNVGIQNAGKQNAGIKISCRIQVIRNSIVNYVPSIVVIFLTQRQRNFRYFAFRHFAIYRSSPAVLL